MSLEDMSAAALKASRKAKKSKDPADHRSAAVLNQKASKATFDKGDARIAKVHAKLAKAHGKFLDKTHESGSRQSESQESKDGVDNPLLTWTKNKLQ